MASLTNFAKAALWYSEHGLPVFPLRTRDKKPATIHGFKEACTERKQIEQWWKENPQANIGIPMGAPSGLLLLDLDFRNGAVIGSRDDLLENFGPLPETAEVITGSGGRHVYFKFPGGAMPKRIAQGIELKGDGGYAVAPPSIHPNGKAYEFDGAEGAKALLHVSEPPQWLLDAIAADGRAGSRKSRSPASDDCWPEGQRNTELTSLAGKLRRAGLSADALFAALMEENLRRCSPPLPDAEVRQVARSIARYPIAEAASGTRSWPGEVLVVNASALDTSVELLNAMAVFHGRIQFKSVARRGSMIIATTTQGQQIIWPTMTDLTSFARARAVIAEGTDVLLPQPPRNQVAKVWDPAAILLVRLAGQDSIRVEHALKDETKALLVLMWRYADQPNASNSRQFMDYLLAISKSVRNRELAAPPCVFVAEEHCWVHVPTFRNWLSLPILTNRLYPLVDIRQGLLLLGFEYLKDVTRGHDGDTESASLWRGPLDVLLD